MNDRGRRATRWLLLASLLLVGLGQAYFIWLPRYVWDGVIFCILGALLWLTAWRLAGSSPAPPVRSRRLLADAAAHPLRTALLVLAALLTIGAGIGARRASPDADFAPYLRAWVLGLLLYPLALVPRLTLPARPRWPPPFRRWMGALPLAALLLAALLTRVVALSEAPPNFGGDEGTQALEALRLMGPPLGNPFATGWYSVPTLSFWIAGMAMRVFGDTVAGVRTLSALAGTAAVLATFLLAQELADRWVAWGAAALVAFGHYAVHFSRLASNQIADALFGPLIFYFLLRGLKDVTDDGNSGPHWNAFLMALAGVILGLSWYTYFGARLVTVVAGLYLAWRAVAEPHFLARNGRGLTALIFGAFLTVWPLALYYVAHPADFLSRYNQVSIFASGWLRQEMAVTGRSATAILLQQFWKSVSAFNVTPDPTFWYRPGIPYLDPLSGVFFIFGLTVAFRRLRPPAEGLVLLWFWAFIILGWTLTENPPSSQRGVGVIPAVSILTALGITETLQVVRRLAGAAYISHFTFHASLYGLLLLVISLLNLNFYFQVYTPRRIYGNPTAEVADVLCDVLEQREEVPPVYFDGEPFMYWDNGAIAFRLRKVTGRDFSPNADLELVDLSQGAIFVVLAEKAADLDIIRAHFPGGEEVSFYSPANARLLFTLYEVRRPR